MMLAEATQRLDVRRLLSHDLGINELEVDPGGRAADVQGTTVVGDGLVPSRCLGSRHSNWRMNSRWRMLHPMSPMTDKQRAAIAHFEGLGRALAETHVVEPRPKDFKELIERMCAIDSRCGMGTEDPLGGDWHSHLAYLRNRRTLIGRRCPHGASR